MASVRYRCPTWLPWRISPALPDPAMMAAFEAVGYAKFSGKVGVCAATSGPGAIHLLNGLYDAKLDHVPVVAIGGQTNRSAMGGSYQQEVDLLSLYKDVASEFCEMVTVPEQLPNVIDRAMRTAYAKRTVTAVVIPADVQELDYSPPTHSFKMVPSSLGLADYAPIPAAHEITRAAEVLNAGEKVAVLIGQEARAEVEQLAELLGAGVAKALLGKDALPDVLPYVTGSIGLLGTRPSYELMRGCDTLLVVGSSFPYTQFMPELDQARAVQIDIEPFMVGLRYPFEVNLPLAGGKSCSAGPPSTPIPPTRNTSSTPWTLCSRTTSFSPPTPAPQRTGTHVTCGCADRCAVPCRAPWPPWGRGCPTSSEPSSLIPTGRPSPSWGSARCR